MTSPKLSLLACVPIACYVTCGMMVCPCQSSLACLSHYLACFAYLLITPLFLAYNVCLLHHRGIKMLVCTYVFASTVFICIYTYQPLTYHTVFGITRGIMAFPFLSCVRMLSMLACNGLVWFGMVWSDMCCRLTYHTASCITCGITTLICSFVFASAVFAYILTNRLLLHLWDNGVCLSNLTLLG